ncbi:PLP-dependent aminotransferase family protein [Bradyrhizobium sp. Leo121]|uniref:aminotransferase-like domain-containing protein n=1 Tax=Bradyrhizobium sp. Leo121 TaxID=1571195 RepID=UPI0010290E2C|nr:PLP-dependent aminotransferase family protein [Bradyrhizobium sp. Leo121]RZN31194.1 PLP-dependent aminotransferase family protein [Bradyrhizobium sp. Leo121]
MAPAHYDRERGATLASGLANRLRVQILSGALPEGSRLPSIRKAAAEFGVSKNTIVEAYDRLVLDNLVTAKAGSGFVITFRGGAEGRPRHVTEAVDIASLLNAQLSQNFEIRVGDGRPPASWTEHSEIKRYLSSNGRMLPADADAYGSALGFLPLRQQIALRLRAQQIAIKEDSLLLTFGANHALDLIIRAMLSPGDTVLVDEPGYYPLFAKLTLAQARIVGVRRMPDGPDVDDLAAKIQTERPKLFFTQSLGHNPTGGSITLPVAHAILKTATRSNLVIVEDDPFVDLPTTANNRLATLDQLNNVISIGTFSKTLSASLRSGFIAARSDRIATLAELKMLTTVNSSGHVERLLHRLLADGHYDRHLKRLGQRTEAALSRVEADLLRAGHQIYSGTKTGYYLYLLLPEGVDDMKLAREGAKESIFIAPGSLFCLDKNSSLAKAIRINVSRADNPKFYEFLLRRMR